MADRLDVAERLAEGVPAVDHTQSYVRACHALGYQHPDLTAQPAQLRDWYGTEDGLDLGALDRDCAELRAAGEAVTEALRVQRAQVAELAAAWTGPGGDAAVRFMERHCDTAATVATELRAAAQRCESLRDNLWYLVDSKVATAIAVDDGTQAQRPAWLAAAGTVTTGVGDRQAAERVVREQVMPYVDNEIRDDWLTTMRSTRDGVATSYDMVTDRMAAAPAVRFDAPTDLGPGCPPVRAAPPTAPPVAVTPAAASPPPDPAPTATTLAPAPPPAAPEPDWGSALGAGAGMPAGGLGGGAGGGLGDGGAGLLGLAGRIVDAVGGLIGSAGNGLGDGEPFDQGDAFDPEPVEADDTDEQTPEADAEHPGDVEDTVEPEPEPAAEPAGPPPPPGAAPVGVPPPPGAAPVDAPAPADAPAAGGPAPPADETKTPCEIAADQLPQAGQ
ncbi:hypothetical protein A5677_10755 [Mycobacterium malmoense]|uniref:Uncharacterized protein n=1 Tax=Mycobacterium malmoense TaxID=1780 RepID=A0A1B9DEK4_MYCMA|nr:hypothetical protein [Mycobacterium malmoense]OCB63271.1 hypothetical protein A5677_10755 [Mycobacterium malmoense]